MFGWAKKERREADRFYVSPDATLGVEVERADAGTVFGQLVDLSQQGAKFWLDTSLQFSEIVVMRLAVPALDISATIKSKILWTRTTASGAWLVGCSFDETLPNVILDGLGRAGFIERRRHPRFATDLTGVARWELGSGATPATITDYSAGGFCMESETLGTIGSKVLVQFEGEGSIFGVVKWSSTDGSRHVHGCEFRQHSERGKGAAIIRKLCQLELSDKI